MRHSGSFAYKHFSPLFIFPFMIICFPDLKSAFGEIVLSLYHDQ